MGAYGIGVAVWFICGLAWAFSTGRVPIWETMLVSGAVFTVCMGFAALVNFMLGKEI